MYLIHRSQVPHKCINDICRNGIRWWLIVDRTLESKPWNTTVLYCKMNIKISPKRWPYCPRLRELNWSNLTVPSHRRGFVVVRSQQIFRNLSYYFTGTTAIIGLVLPRWTYPWISAERRNSSAIALELRLSCSNPSICFKSSNDLHTYSPTQTKHRTTRSCGCSWDTHILYVCKGNPSWFISTTATLSSLLCPSLENHNSYKILVWDETVW